MVVCCIPSCNTDSWRCDKSISFHDFPSNPDLAAKWIAQINSVLNNGGMWFPRGKAVVCSKHFLQTDFKADSDDLKPRCKPTVFGFKYIGTNPETNDRNKRKNEFTNSPLIVKVIKPSDSVSAANSIDVSTVSVSAEFHGEEENQPAVVTNASNQRSFSASPEKVANTNLSSSIRTFSKVVPTIPKPSVMSPNIAVGKEPSVGRQKGITNLYNRGAKKMTPRSKKNQNHGSDLIEIGPNTFLKINPDIIKVNKKQTPSGNTVLQFIMNQKLALSQGDNLLPKLIQNVTNSANADRNNSAASSNNRDNHQGNVTHVIEKEPVVQHVLGHLVDTHICKDSCSELKQMQDEALESAQDDGNSVSLTSEVAVTPEKDAAQASKPVTQNTSATMNGTESNADSSCIAKAPVLLTTNVPLSHCFMEKPKYLSQMRQKSRQISSLKLKVGKLTKKIEELEDKCIVQERQLSYSFIKRLKTIRKNASKGDPCATYILEQIHGYAGKTKMRWSETTLTQCAIWCRKAPYAYEYFKKGEFFKLPCLGTVKRFMKSHPELKYQNKANTNKINPDGDDDSSSDFDFDETDSESDKDGNGENIPCETVLTIPSEASYCNQTLDKSEVEMQESSDQVVNTNEIPNQGNANHEVLVTESHIISHTQQTHQEEGEKQHIESNGQFQIEVDRSNLEVQEIILPSGEVVQCFSSTVCNGQDIGNQYYIIPTVNDSNVVADHQYSVVQSDSLPVILQNLDGSQLQGQQQEQLIFITNSSDQIECSQTEVTSA